MKSQETRCYKKKSKEKAEKLASKGIEAPGKRMRTGMGERGRNKEGDGLTGFDVLIMI